MIFTWYLHNKAIHHLQGMQMILPWLFLFCMFRDLNLAPKMTNLMENLEKKKFSSVEIVELNFYNSGCDLSDIFLVAISVSWLRGDNSLNKCNRFIQQLFPSISLVQMSRPYFIHMENTVRFLLKIVIYFSSWENGYERNCRLIKVCQSWKKIIVNNEIKKI